MRIVTVIPISKGIAKDTLTYFTKGEVVAGSIVSIPLRSRTVFGLVVSSRLAEELKSELKSLDYSIKKINNLDSRKFLSDEFIRSCEKIADFNAGSVGAVLFNMIPKIVLEESDKLKFTIKEKPAGIFHETLLLQTDDDERYSTYRGLIREEFAKSRSVFFCLPTTEDLLNAKGVLEKGIEKYTFTLHSGLSKNEIIKIWKEVTESAHPVLIISTGAFLSIPRGDLGTIILEKESSRGYAMQTRPYIDLRVFAEIFAKTSGIRLVLGDTLLRVETLWEEKNGRYAPLSPLKFRQVTTGSAETVNTRTPQDMKKKEFAIFSDKLKELIKTGRENNENTFLFCGRKGLYPITVCSDCGTVVVCKNCQKPVVLYGAKSNQKKNSFVCNGCGEKRDPAELCLHCKGWRLNPLGIGTEKVGEEILSLFPDAKVILMDKDNIKTHKQAVKARDLFYSTPGSIMVGTEMALSYLNQKIANSAVVSIDSYFSIPDFRINEKIFHILLALRALSVNRMIIQTRQEEGGSGFKIFNLAVRGNLVDFYRDEIEERKQVGFPPFKTYIKISLEGDKSTVKKKMLEVAELLLPYKLDLYDAWSAGSSTKYTVNGLLAMQNDKWVDETLLQKLRLLPPQYMIRVNPSSLL